MLCIPGASADLRYQTQLILERIDCPYKSLKGKFFLVVMDLDRDNVLVKEYIDLERGYLILDRLIPQPYTLVRQGFDYQITRHF